MALVPNILTLRVGSISSNACSMCAAELMAGSSMPATTCTVVLHCGQVWEPGISLWALELAEIVSQSNGSYLEPALQLIESGR